MRPDYTPEFESNGISISDTPLQLGDSSKLSKQEIEACKTQNFEIKLKTKPCNCILCRHDYRKIGIKKAIKFNSSKASIYKKIIKKLKDSGVNKSYLTENRSKEGDLFFAEEAYKWHMYANCGLRSIRKGSRNVHNN